MTANSEALVIRRARPADRDWIASVHAQLYARDEQFDESFGALVEHVLEAFFENHDPARECGLIAERKGRPVGSVFCAREDDVTARLRLFLLLPEARGRGIGQMLHDALLGFAAEAGYGRIVLATHESHQAACRLYARNGWELLSRKPVHSFGRDLVELAFAKVLTKNLQSGRSDPLAPGARGR